MGCTHDRAETQGGRGLEQRGKPQQNPLPLHSLHGSSGRINHLVTTSSRLTTSNPQLRAQFLDKVKQKMHRRQCGWVGRPITHPATQSVSCPSSSASGSTSLVVQRVPLRHPTTCTCSVVIVVIARLAIIFSLISSTCFILKSRSSSSPPPSTFVHTPCACRSR